MNVFYFSTLALLGTLAIGQQVDNDLSVRLASERTRTRAIEEILKNERTLTPVLLSWTENLPNHADPDGLMIGLIDAFAKLKTREAIPFLIKCISVKRTGPVDLAPWLKVPEVIVWTFPAIDALIQMGPPAARELIRRAREPMTPEERLAAIFVVAHISGVPEADAY
jgi:HEAT repeat protein